MIEAYLKAYYEAYGNYTGLLVNVVLAIPNRESGNAPGAKSSTSEALFFCLSE